MSAVITQINRSPGGLPKLPVEGILKITAEGLEGDWQRNRKYHGGPDKAVLMIAAEAVDELASQGFKVTYGSLGENLTVRGLDRRSWRSGQRYRVGEGCVIELTTQRVPCTNLDPYGPGVQKAMYDAACKANDHASARWANGGFYARVIRQGVVFAGSAVELIEELA
jgi:MOSC domain-containing protein YiiM